jgi:hypothetical protein
MISLYNKYKIANKQRAKVHSPSHVLYSKGIVLIENQWNSGVRWVHMIKRRGINKIVDRSVSSQVVKHRWEILVDRQTHSRARGKGILYTTI